MGIGKGISFETWLVWYLFVRFQGACLESRYQNPQVFMIFIGKVNQPRIGLLPPEGLKFAQVVPNVFVDPFCLPECTRCIQLLTGNGEVNRWKI